MASKTIRCNECKRDLPARDFNRDKSNTLTGRQRKCRSCGQYASKRWRRKKGVKPGLVKSDGEVWVRSPSVQIPAELDIEIRRLLREEKLTFAEFARIAYRSLLGKIGAAYAPEGKVNDIDALVRLAKQRGEARGSAGGGDAG